jgi:methylmalonyl-CoA mutase cobalamin-binding subunit
LPNGQPRQGLNGSKRSDDAPSLTIGYAATDELDELALETFAHLLAAAGHEIKLLPSESLVGEVVTRIREDRPAAIVIAAVPPGGAAPIRYLCKRLRKNFPDLRILVGRWGLTHDVEETRERLRAAGADHMAVTLAETRNQLIPVIQALREARRGQAMAQAG